MNLYQGYCYATITEAADAELSQNPIPTSAGLSSAYSYSVLTASTVSMNYNYKSVSGAVNTFPLTRTYPECAQVGYQHNLTGLSLQDVTTSSWLVIAVWAAVWGIKQMRRAL